MDRLPDETDPRTPATTPQEPEHTNEQTQVPLPEVDVDKDPELDVPTDTPPIRK